MLTVLATWGCGDSPQRATSAAGQSSEAAPLLPSLRMEFEALENRRSSRGAESFVASLTLNNTGTLPLEGEWALYFNFQRDVVPESLPAAIEVERINGDFQLLRPTPAFRPLEPGESRRIEFEGLWPLTKITDAPMGAYLLMEADGDPIPVEVQVGQIAPPAGGHPAGRLADRPLIPTPASRYRENARVSPLPSEQVLPLVPTPLLMQPAAGVVLVDASWHIVHEPELESEADVLASALEALLGARPQVSAGGPASPTSISLVLASEGLTAGGVARSPGAEAYLLTIAPGEGIRVLGSDPAGVFYGIQTLRALAPLEAYRAPLSSLELPAVRVEDAPRFPHRGFHLDVARNFQTRETVEKLLALMAFYKLNRFHFHLTDDEGWRLPVAALPELTQVGGRRGHTTDERDRLVPSFGSGPFPDPVVSHGSGFYSREDFVGILRRARELHIEVTTEIDGPGHARAAVKSMEERHRRLLAEGREEEARAFLLTDREDRSGYRSVQGWNDHVINPCLESTCRFLETVIDEIGVMYEEAGAELRAVHIGGDEVPRGVWEESPACETFLNDHPEIGDAHGLFPYYVDRVSALLKTRGLVTSGWEEIALREDGGGRVGKSPHPDLLDRGLLPYIWNNVWRGGAEDLGYRLANAGYPVVLSNATNLYFDLAYDRDPREPGFTWAGLTDTRAAYEFVPFDLFKSAREDLMGRPIDPDAEFRDRTRLNATGRRNVQGIQGQLWGENALGREGAEYLAFPKLLGLAERAWAAPPAWTEMTPRADRDRVLDMAWKEFANRLGSRELPRLDHLEGGVTYRLPPPGAVIADGVLRANVSFPGLAIRYTTDGSEPTVASPRYQGPVPVEGETRLRTFDSRGRGGRVSRVVGGPDRGGG